MKVRTPRPRPVLRLPILPLEPEPLEGLSTEEREAAVAQLAVLLREAAEIQCGEAIDEEE